MSFLPVINYGTWYFWELFPQKVTFDGINKEILINEQETEIDVEIDLYSNWKEWVQYLDNAKFSEALSTVGGDPLAGARELGSTFFLENGWKVRPFGNINKTININGNLYTRDGSSPFLDADEGRSISIISTVSTLVEFVNLESVAPNNQLIASNVWSENISGSLASVLLESASNTTILESNLTTTIVTETANAVSSDTRLVLIEKLLRNRTETNPTTGIMTVFDDDNTTPLLAANIFEDVAGTSSYDSSSTRVDRRDKLA